MNGLICRYEFDIELVRELIRTTFNKGELEGIVKPHSIAVRFANGNSFHVGIHDYRQCVYANCRRKYTSLKPDWEEEYSLESETNIDSLFQVVRSILTSLNEKYEEVSK